MEEFKISKAKGVLKKCVTAKAKGKDENKATLSNDVHIVITVNDRSKDAVDYLFPSFEEVEKSIAGRDGEHPGLKMQTKGEVPELNVTIFDGGGNEEVFAFQNIGLTGQPSLIVNSLGDSKLILRLDAHLTKKDMSKLVDYTGADIYISAEVAQMSLPGVNGKAKEKTTIHNPVQQTIDGSAEGDEIRQLRENAGWSRGELVAILEEEGISTSTKSLQRYENGDRACPPDVSNAIRNASTRVAT